MIINTGYDLFFMLVLGETGFAAFVWDYTNLPAFYKLGQFFNAQPCERSQ